MRWVGLSFMVALVILGACNRTPEPAVDLSPIEKRLDAIDRRLADDGVRMKKIEVALDELNDRDPIVELPPKAPDKPAGDAKLDPEKLQREFDMLPNGTQIAIKQARKALESSPMEGLATRHIVTIVSHKHHFSTMTPDQIFDGVLAAGDKKGARQQIEILGVMDPKKRLALKWSFGLTSDATCKQAIRFAEIIKSRGVRAFTDAQKAFIRDNSDMFPDV